MGTEAKQVQPYDQSLYDYRRKAFAYPSKIPVPVLSFSSAEGLKGGWGYQFITRSFGKEIYASKHKISAYISTLNNFGVLYSGKFRQIAGEWDLALEGEWSRPDRYNNFFGLGNETVLVDSLFANNFYRSRNRTFNMSIGLHRTFWEKSTLRFDLRAEKNDRQEVENNILESEEFSNLLGTQDLKLFQAQLVLDLDFRDHTVFPNRGMQFYASQKNGLIPTNKSNYGMSEAFLSWYGTNHSIKSPLTLGIKIGGGDGYGPIPFYNKFTLGQRENLHGFQRRRFTGDAMAYLNTELRLELGKKKAIIPIIYGLTAFFDQGRVFLDGEDSQTWHKGYGLGVYLIPASRKFSFQMVFGVAEENQGLLMFNFGSLLR